LSTLLQMERVVGGWAEVDRSDDRFQEVLAWTTAEVDSRVESERAVRPLEIVRATQQVSFPAR
jgi:hypothetical protein